MGAVHTNLGGRYQAVMMTAKHMGEVEFPVYHHTSKPDTNAVCSVEGADPSIVAVSATFRYHTDMNSMFSMDELYMDIGDGFFPQGPRILCMYASVTQLRYYRQTGYFRERHRYDSHGGLIDHVYEFLCAPPEELAKDDFGGRPSNVDFVIIIDFEKARKRYKFFQARRPITWNMFVSCCNGADKLNILDYDLIVGLYSIAKKGIVYFYEPSKPDTWLQTLPVNVGADSRLGCPQVYTMIYAEGLKTNMPGPLASKIVVEARNAVWTWSNRIGMHVLARPAGICVDCNSVIMGQVYRHNHAFQDFIPSDAKCNENALNPGNIAHNVCPAPQGYTDSNVMLNTASNDTQRTRRQAFEQNVATRSGLADFAGKGAAERG